MWTELCLAYEGPSDTRDTKIIALGLKFNAFKALEGEKVNGTYTRLKCLLNDLENNRVIISQSEVNATFVNNLPTKWLSLNQTQRANNSIKNDSLAALYGNYHYKEGLINDIYASKTQTFTIQVSSSKALISNNHFQDNDSDVEKDNRTNNEFMADLNAEYHERTLLANQKRYYKRSGRLGSSRKPIDKSKETCFAYGKPGHCQKDCPSNKTSTPSYPSSNTFFNKPKPYTPSFTLNIPQKSSIYQKDYKVMYKGLKAEMVVLSQRMDELTKGKNDKKGDKGKSDKRLVAESFNWDNESVSSEDEGTTKFKAFMVIAEDEPSVGKCDVRSGQWVNITMKKEKTDQLKGSFFTKTDVSTSESAPMITSDSEDDSDNQDYLKRPVWYIDSGCSRHMTSEIIFAHNAKESGPKVVFGDKSSGDTEGYGSVNCNGITLTKVAYVNGLKHNLISISQLCDANFKVLFTKTQGTIFNEKDEVVLIAPRRRDVYVINMSSYIQTIMLVSMLKPLQVKDDEAISQTSIEGDAINFNKVNSFPDDEFKDLSIPNIKDIVPALDEAVHPESAATFESTNLQEDDRDEPIDDQPLLQVNSPLVDSVSGLWYPKGSCFDRKAYLDSDYADCNLDRKVPLRDVRYVEKSKDNILKGNIELYFVPTDLQLADIFTKPLANPRFTRLVSELGMLNIEKEVKCSHWQYKFPLLVKVIATARRLEMPLPEVRSAIEEKKKKLPVKDRWQLH
nr:retrovirus-related Pol polyprotein from transposon TNT 1-94 [Tanacetum cinerariifolium]